MAAYLITHSLLSSWLHLIRENPYEDLTTEGDPLAEFMLVLKREPTPRTEAMQEWGISFLDAPVPEQMKYASLAEAASHLIQVLNDPEHITG